MFTIFLKSMSISPEKHLEFTKKMLEELEYVRYAIAQVEKCPKTGRYHIQGYVEFNKKITTKKFKEDMIDNTIHLEVRRGTKAQAKAYCSKEETRVCGPMEIGKLIGQGKRTDLDELIDNLSDIDNIKDIAKRHPKQFILYSRGIKQYMDLIYEPEKWRQLTVNVLWGDTGVGKTKQVFDECGTDLYKLDYSNSLWWDGYNGQKNLLIDDFYGWIKYGHLLNILDGYPLRLEVKGGFTSARFTKVWITSNKHPSEWYSTGMTPALERRLTSIKEIKSKDLLIF